MGMTLSGMREKVATVTVEWQGDKADVGYFPAAMTPALIENVQKAAKDTDDESLDVMGEWLEPLLAWWDLFADAEAEANGVRLGTDAATIKTLPMAWSMAVLDAIQGDMKVPGSKG